MAAEIGTSTHALRKLHHTRRRASGGTCNPCLQHNQRETRQTLVCVQRRTRHLKPREPTWSPHRSGGGGCAEQRYGPLGPWVERTQIELLLEVRDKHEAEI